MTIGILKRCIQLTMLLSALLSMSKRYFACDLFIDFQKALDTVDINVLIEKLLNYGVHGPANQWLNHISKDVINMLQLKLKHEGSFETAKLKVVMVTLVGMISSCLDAWGTSSISRVGSQIMPDWPLRISKIETGQ